MGISVISPPASASPGIAGIGTQGATQALADNTLPVDFAAMLIGQISGFQSATTALSEVATASGKPGENEPIEVARDIFSPLDPALTPQIALAYSVPEQVSTLPTLPTATPKGDATRLPGLDLLPPMEQEREKATHAGKDTQSPPLLGDSKASITATTSAQTVATQAGALAATPREAAILAGENSNTTSPTFAATLANQASVPTQSAPTASPPAIATPLQDSRWSQDFGNRIIWMAKNDQQQAQINITPPQMGPIQITLSMSGDQASIAFASPHAEVRKAIEDALPNLREMLSTSGINLGQSDVGAEMKQQQRELAGQFANGQRFTGETAILPVDNHLGSKQSGRPIQQGRGLVDLFA